MSRSSRLRAKARESDAVVRESQFQFRYSLSLEFFQDGSAVANRQRDATMEKIPFRNSE